MHRAVQIIATDFIKGELLFYDYAITGFDIFGQFKLNDQWELL